MAGKIITIDWPTIAALPSDEYHIKLLNKQQAAVLQALCEYQHWQSRWDNLEISQDELDRFMGDIEYRLMGDEDNGMATMEDIRDGICEGLECSFERLAARYLSGSVGGFSVGDDGVVTGGDDEPAVELPEDDPMTELDETEASRGGGMYAIAKGVNALIALVNTYYGVDATADMTPTEATTLIGLQYKIDETLMTAALTDMWAIKGASLAVIAALSESAVAGSLYCKGLSYQSINRVVLATAGISTNSKIATADIVSAITMEQLGDWYESGVGVPTTLYKEFTCVPSPTEIVFGGLQAFINSVTNWKGNHRLLFTVENYYTDSTDGDIVDFWWYRTAAGVLTSRIAANSFVLGSGITKPTTNQVPYRSDHKYTFTIDTPASGGAFQIVIQNTGITTPVASVPAEGFKLTVVDLGEILI